MKNVMNEEVKAFVEKLQEVGLELYNEFNQLNTDGMTYECPLTNTIDALYEFYLLNPEDAIDETKLE